MRSVAIFAFTILFLFLGSPFRRPGREWLEARFKKDLDALAANAGAFAQDFAEAAKKAYDFDGLFVRFALAGLGTYLLLPDIADGTARRVAEIITVAIVLFVPALLVRLKPDKDWDLKRLGRQSVPRIALAVLASAGLALSVAADASKTPSPTTSTSLATAPISTSLAPAFGSTTPTQASTSTSLAPVP